MIFFLRPNSRQFYSIKMDAANIRKTVASVEKTWSKYFPSDPFNYFFLDDSFGKQYKSDEMFGSVFSLVAFQIQPATHKILRACKLLSRFYLQKSKKTPAKAPIYQNLLSYFFFFVDDFFFVTELATTFTIFRGFWSAKDHYSSFQKARGYCVLQ